MFDYVRRNPDYRISRAENYPVREAGRAILLRWRYLRYRASAANGHEMRAAGRLPPGQSLTLKWPVLHEGSVPRFDSRTWDFRVFGLVEKQVRVELAPEVYDRATIDEKRQALRLVGRELLPIGSNSTSVQ